MESIVCTECNTNKPSTDLEQRWSAAIVYCKECPKFLCAVHTKTHKQDCCTKGHKTCRVCALAPDAMEELWDSTPQLFPPLLRSPLCHHCFSVAGKKCFDHPEAVGAVFCRVCRKFLCHDHSTFHGFHWASVSHTVTEIEMLPSRVLEAYRIVDPHLFPPCAAVPPNTARPRTVQVSPIPESSSPKLTQLASAELDSIKPNSPTASVRSCTIINSETPSVHVPPGESPAATISNLERMEPAASNSSSGGDDDG
eukprot:Rmarinus@m.7112